MTDHWNQVCIDLGDALLGWSLSLPRDMTLLVIVALSVVLMLALRRLIAPLELLRAIADDERRLRELISQARQNGDREARTRHRHVRAVVAGARFRAELVPALASFVPLAVLLTWAGARLDSLPITAETPFQLTARLPASSIGELVHLVPTDGVEVESGWIREVQIHNGEAGVQGTATWTLTVDASPKPLALVVSFRDATLVHPVLVGQGRYVQARIDHGRHAQTGIALKKYRPLQFVPGVTRAGMPPWCVGYLGLAIPLFLWGKRLAKLA